MDASVRHVWARPALLVLALVLLASPALGHVPGFGADNDTPGNATVVENPTKSWAFYDTLDADGSAYYEARLLDGERLYASVYTPRADRRPGLVVLSPTIEGAEGVPAQVSVPDGYGARVVDPTASAEAEFEPFTPGAYHYTAEFDREVAGGTYLLAVYEAGGRPGPVGLALGRSEQFTPAEYLTVPIDVLAIHAWEGDSPLLVVGPGLALAIVALVRLRGRLLSGDSPVARTALGLAALAMVATSVNLAVQTALAAATAGPTALVLVPLVLVAVPLIIAWWLLGLATRDELSLSLRRRVGLVLSGLGALLTWGGLILAPLVPLAVALVPGARLR